MRKHARRPPLDSHVEILDLELDLHARGPMCPHTSEIALHLIFVGDELLLQPGHVVSAGAAREYVAMVPA